MAFFICMNLELVHFKRNAVRNHQLIFVNHLHDVLPLVHTYTVTLNVQMHGRIKTAKNN